MIDPAAIVEIIATYKKYGWTLRRVLLSPAMKDGLPRTAREAFGNAAILDSDIDAMWFSRGRSDGDTTWELRHISNAPFAMVAVLKAADGSSEPHLAATEDEFRSAIAARTSGH
ncbi:MAG: hypothetical protein IT172_07265 [Acidobacteria bacterium]|nr:hypothetical protein [Acidobacteriota bacterium]